MGDFTPTNKVHDEQFQKLKDWALDSCAVMTPREVIAIMAQMSGVISMADPLADYPRILQGNFQMGQAQGVGIIHDNGG